jgi:hypothetical protein
MTARIFVRAVLPLLVVSLCLTAPVAGRVADDVRMDGVETQQKGRYKKQGDNCVWDANDTGPNQCTPEVTGRFKKDGDKCVWDANDKGPDQCSPTGRWKKEGDKCVWAPGDAGPNQCNPRRPR